MKTINATAEIIDIQRNWKPGMVIYWIEIESFDKRLYSGDYAIVEREDGETTVSDAGAEAVDEALAPEIIRIGYEALKHFESNRTSAGATYIQPL